MHGTHHGCANGTMALFGALLLFTIKNMGLTMPGVAKTQKTWRQVLRQMSLGQLGELCMVDISICSTLW